MALLFNDQEMEMKDREFSEWKILKSISERRDLRHTQNLDYPKKSEESEVRGNQAGN